MKKGIHPKYNIQTKATCACGAIYYVGSTGSSEGEDEIKVEICSSCHPFFTGKENILDTAGRVERFNKRKAASVKAKAKK